MHMAKMRPDKGFLYGTSPAAPSRQGMKGDGMAGIGVPELIVLVMLVWVFTIPFWIWAVINIVRSDFRDNAKIVWLLVVILLYTLGVVLYAFIGRKQKIKRPG
jgi:hypothetical protein